MVNSIILKLTLLLCIVAVVFILRQKLVYQLLFSSKFSSHLVSNKFLNQSIVETTNCDPANITTQAWKAHCAAIFTTLEEFTSSKYNANSSLYSNLTLSSWRATISPACIGPDRRIVTFSLLSARGMHLIVSSDTEPFNNDTESLRQSYWDHIKYNWKIVEKRTEVILTAKSVFIRGHTFVTDGNDDNIGHAIQHLACDMAAAIGAKSSHFNATINLQIMNESLTSFVVTAIVDVIALTQRPVPLRRLLWLDHQSFMCFEHLTFQRPDACGGFGLERRPANQKKTLQLVRSALFRRLKLPRMSVPIDRHTLLPCMRRILIYDRNNTVRRRLMNTDAIKNSITVDRCLNVTVIHSIPKLPIDQAMLLNSVDVFIMPHGATAYLSLFLPDFAWLIELGLNTWIKHGLISALPLFYHHIDFGVDLIKYDPNFDRQGSAAVDRSFTINRTAIDFIKSRVLSNACTCQV